MIYLTNGRKGQASGRKGFRSGATATLQSPAVERVPRTSEAEGLDHAGLRGTSIARQATQKAIAAALSCGLLLAAEPSTVSRTVTVSKADVIPVYTQYKYVTLVQLPKGEEIMLTACGECAKDGGKWSIQSNGNSLLIKPLGEVKHTAGDTTSIQVIAASGNAYTFLAKEVSNIPGQLADLRLFLASSDADALQAIEHPQFVPAEQVADLKKQLDAQSAELKHEKDSGALKEVQALRHNYEWKHGKEADVMGLRAIYNDGTFTYIEAHSQEAPAVYERKDGKDMIVQYSLSGGLYVIPHVVEDGLMKVGKAKLEFKRSNL